MAFRDRLLALFFTSMIIYASTLDKATADSIQGCGGFVEASVALIKSRKATDAKLDYSHITVELRTLDGLVKDRTQCAPNGYYFIPVYDKGSFIVKVKGPEGWSWDPEQVPIVVDQNGCNANEDINFRFTGFTMSGRIVGAVGGKSCTHKNGGPADVKVDLLSHTGRVLSSVSTSPAGGYTFANIPPGKYKLHASRDDLNIEVRGSPEVELGFGNTAVDDVFFVPGYDIRGFVVAQGNPILGVHVYLYSDDISEVYCPQGSGNAPAGGNALCHAVSDADGVFTFKSVPCGAYKLIPFYKGENTVFDVSPPSMLVSVGQDHAIVPEKFQVTGFSVGGRVVDGIGMGVDGVKIVVDGEERSVTDKEGHYKLDQVTSRRYTVEARKEHYKFDKLNDFLVLPNMASLVDIKAVSYDVCGTVQTINSNYRTKVALTHGPENVKPQVKLTDIGGRFCFEVPPGEYRLSAFAAVPENAPELLLSPPYVDLKVNNPTLNIKFHQAQISLHGSVVCKEKCGSSVSVALVGLHGTSKEERKTSGLTDQSSEFMFLNVLPGKYRVEVKNELPDSTPGYDKWCWEQTSINLDIGTEDIMGIVFVQKGYWVNIISSHDVDGYLAQPDGSHLNLKIKKGSQNICVESPGVHELHFVNSCIFFGSSSVKIDTSHSLPIHLEGQKYLLEGHIHVEANLPIDVGKLPKNIVVDILDKDGNFISGTTAVTVLSKDDQVNDAIYEYSIWADPGRQLTFVPRDSRNDGEKRILFYPRKRHVSVMQDGCQPEIPLFTGRFGMYIEGSISPPLSGVYIRVIATEDSRSSNVKQGDLVLETTTGVDGHYVVGPLYDDTNYKIEASKPGYHVKPVGPYSFSCQKLSQISVRIFSSDNDDAKEPFPSALLSLSGEDGYRNNSVSGIGGTFLFDNLFPGSFYLRPLLKEYAFSPAAQAIELGSGESKDVVFQATRVAFSAMGSVTLLSGQPKEGVPVEARADSKGLYEETVTDSLGSFRLRGLLPNTTYTIRVAKKGDYTSSRIERASPESVAIEVGSEDLKGLDFVVFEQPETTILSGHVDGKRIKELNSLLRVEIKSSNDPSRIESTFPLPPSNFFQVKDLPAGKHLVQLKSDLSSITHRFQSEVIEVDLERNRRVHIGPINFKVEEDQQKQLQELTPAPVYPLIVGVSVIALFISMPRLKDLYQASAGLSVSGSTATVKKEAKKLVVKKKTY